MASNRVKPSLGAAQAKGESLGWAFPSDFDGAGNPFRDRFGELSNDEWCETLIASMTAPIMQGLEFPRFPASELQEHTHGSSGETALREAAGFYKYVASRDFFAAKAVPGASFLDFGSGWGRIARFFLRHFDLDRYFGFEPQRSSRFRTRSLDPYLCVLNGGYLPDRSLPPDRFDMVVGWSVFSHLSEHATGEWLDELARVMRSGGYCVMSVFGDRFLDQLVGYHAASKAGEDIHWYYRYVLEAAGDIVALRESFRRGKLVWIEDHPGHHYGAATFLPEAALLNIIAARELPFDLIEFDRSSTNMEIFVLRRRRRRTSPRS